MEDKWYVVRVQGNREKSISEKLKKYSTEGELIGKLSEVVSPMKKEFMVKNGKKVNPVNYFYSNLSPQEFDEILKISNQENQSLD